MSESALYKNVLAREPRAPQAARLSVALCCNGTGTARGDRLLGIAHDAIATVQRLEVQLDALSAAEERSRLLAEALDCLLGYGIAHGFEFVVRRVHEAQGMTWAESENLVPADELVRSEAEQCPRGCVDTEGCGCAWNNAAPGDHAA